jgi:hypothetical protein
MKISVVKSYHDPKLYSVEIKQGVQYFRLAYHASKDECRWMAKMFCTALKNHDLEQASKFIGLVKPESRHSR